MRTERVIGCRSEALALALDGDIVVHLEAGPQTLRADDTKGRAQLITAIRGGQHAELTARATTFRQKDGVPNRRFLRHAPAALPALAASYVGMPFLVDHDTASQSSRVGTITSSEPHDHGGTGWSSFKMGLKVVKPEAVISVLDGTIDRFSIGWARTGPVLCTAHGVDVTGRDRCGCWPGDTVMLDGKPHVVEYEFQSAKGTEVSAVNVPAVEGTGISEIRAALAAELSFVVSVPPAKEIAMLSRLAAALGLATLTAAEEDRAVTIIEQERSAAARERTSRLAAEQERDTARTRITQVEAELATVKTSGTKAAVDAAIENAYRDGKLRFGRDSEGAAIPSRFEGMLRKLAASEGIDALKGELAGMPKVVPIGERPLDKAKEPARENPGNPSELSDDEKAVAEEMGLDPKDMLETKRQMGGR